MATTRRVRGVKPRAVIAAGLLAAAAIASIPARAATIPVLESTSVENGWSHGKFLIAKYDQDIRGTTAPAVSVTKGDGSAVLDGLGATIPFDVSTSFSKSFLVHDLVVVVPNLTNRVDENNVPLRSLPQGDYKMTVQATGRSGGLTSTLATKTFKVDNLGPSTLRITAPANRSVAAPGELTLAGIASDNTDSGAFRSGIASVQLFFYNAADPLSYQEVEVQGPEGTPIPTYQPGEVTSLRTYATLAACDLDTPGCVGKDISGNDIVVQEMSYTADLSDLDPGVWTVKARATDTAGNQSAEVSVTFVKAA